MIRQVCECDECGKIKGEANHWMVGSSSFRYGSLYGVGKWPASDENLPYLQHFCGQQCALKYQAKQLEIA